MTKISSEILLRGVLFAASKMQQLVGGSGSPYPPTTCLFVPLPLPDPGSAPAHDNFRAACKFIIAFDNHVI